jgi:serine/threonine protein kinase
VAEPERRWVEVTPSQFTHEAEGLNFVKKLMPDQPPFRAWSNFEFRDSHGKWHEIDLLVLGHRRLHLVELKYYSGTLKGDDHRWLRDGHRAEDSPLKLARRKAQRLASKLRDELVLWAKETGADIPNPREIVPFVQESVFLHHPNMRCALAPGAKIDLFGLDDSTETSGLPGISERLLETAGPHKVIGANQDQIIAALLKRIGVVQRRQREAGSWVIDEEPLAEGEGWQDWPAFHKLASTERARIRFMVTAPGAAETERARVSRVAEHEYRIMSRLAHEGLLRPRDLVDSDLGVGLVYPHDERFQRLDLWLAGQPAGLPVADQFSILRQVAESVHYAHGNKVVHRGLTPQAVYARPLPGGGVKVLVGDWQSAGSVSGSTLTGLSSAGVTMLHGAMEMPQPGASRIQAVLNPAAGVDADRAQAEAFEAPEGAWSPDADRVRLDVFGLGALAYFVLTGRPAAANRTTLRERLRRDGGLDVAADLPQVSPPARAMVLEATRPAVSERTPNVGRFLEQLSAAERTLVVGGEEATDSLEATPGEVIVGRFKLERRLGAGSTAVGLLVSDLSIGPSGPDAERVLKVALDDAAAGRLEAEAEVLSTLRHPRLVRMVEGPIDVGGRRALVLESAGNQTLAEVLRNRARLSIDLLERYGTDLLEALVALDRAGVDHRDIKPSNLGVREGRGDRTKHLVLFDFSLSRAGATALGAGTPPYLDPFLDDPKRGRFDSAAERYSAGVVLFEMATGSSPVYGDGLSDPASVSDEVTISEDQFDPSVAEPLTDFFRSALARQARARHDTAAEMLVVWQSVFAPVAKTVPDDADALAAAAEPTTPLTAAGLSARALSALEPYAVSTVGDLVAVDPVRLNQLAGVAEATRREVKQRARDWRDRFAALVIGRGTSRREETQTTDGGLITPAAAAELLLAASGSARAESRRALLRLILGIDGDADAFASQAELSTAVAPPVTAARVTQHLTSLQDSWAADDVSRAVLDGLGGVVRAALSELGGVATVEELTRAVQAGMRVDGTNSHDPQAFRTAAGLLRLALDRARARERADAGDEPLTTRRRRGRTAILASDFALVDVAEGLGHAADALVTRANVVSAPGHPVEDILISTGRASEVLRLVVTRALGEDAPRPLIEDERLLKLSAALSNHAEVSGALELHHRELSPATAMALALKGVGAQPLRPQEIRDRVRARFPALAPLPDRPRLDDLVREAHLELYFDEKDRVFRSRTRIADTTGLESRQATRFVPVGAPVLAQGHLGGRLLESASARSFLALGVPASRVDRAVTVLVREHHAVVVDVTSVLISAMREAASALGLPWDLVRAADAAPSGGREAQGLTSLVQRSVPSVEAAIERASAQAVEGSQPVLLVEVGPLARYGYLNSLSRWTDLGTKRSQAVWLVVPQLMGNQGAAIDGRPLPLAAPGQFLPFNADWIDSQAKTDSVPADSTAVGEGVSS